MIDSAPPYDVVTLMFQKNAATWKLNAEAAADEDQESCAFLILHPPRTSVATRMYTPLDLDSLAVARISNVLEVAQEPSAVQCRILARVAHVHAVIHAAGH